MRHTQRLIKWDAQGKPVPTDIEIISKDTVSDLPLRVLSLPYKRTEFEKEMGVDEDLEGLTNAEVMHMRLAHSASRGDQKAIDMLLDRIIGKPKITTENKNLNINYQDYLESLAEKEE